MLIYAVAILSKKRTKKSTQSSVGLRTHISIFDIAAF